MNEWSLLYFLHVRTHTALALVLVPFTFVRRRCLLLRIASSAIVDRCLCVCARSTLVDIPVSEKSRLFTLLRSWPLLE